MTGANNTPPSFGTRFFEKIGHLLASPFTLFILFALVHGILAYASVSFQVRIAFVFLGLLLPWGFAYTAHRFLPRPSASPETDHTPSISPGGALVLGFLALTVYFYRLTSYPTWLLGDEASAAIFGLDLTRHWRWDLLWGEGRIEPLFYWLLSLIFRLIPPSFEILRWTPALITLGSLLFFYGALRTFLSRRWALWGLGMASVNFWTLLISRIALPTAWFPFWECLSFLCLGKAWQAGDASDRNLWWAGLGLSVGAGFYTTPAWTVTAVTMFLPLVWPMGARRLPWKKRLACIGIALAMMFPVLMARLGFDGMKYISGLVSPTTFLRSFSDYFSSLFWNGSGSVPYGPHWGGLFNPVMGSLAFLGVLDLAIRRPRWAAAWAVAFFLGMLPGSLTHHVETFRIVAVYPLILTAAAYGLNTLSGAVPTAFRLVLVLSVLVLSTALDLHHWTGPYTAQETLPSDKRHWRLPAFERAYKILGRLPGDSYHFYGEFTTDYDDRTLSIAAYKNNILRNPRLRSTGDEWTALLVHSEYRSYLLARFPGALVIPVDRPGSEPQAFAKMYLLPPHSLPPDEEALWRDADQLCWKIHVMIKHQTSTNAWDRYAEILRQEAPRFEKDPFLNTLIWEKTGFFYLLADRMKEARSSYERAARNGYPLSHLRTISGRIGDLPSWRDADPLSRALPATKGGR